MSVSDVDKQLWLAYCKVVQKAVGGLPGHKPALFFTKQAQKAPVASQTIDPSYTNYGINSIINNLLQTNDLFYDPSHHKTYIHCLLEYILSVKIGDDNPAIQARIEMAGKDFTVALDKALAERDRALDDFEKQEGHGMTGEMDFSQWWPSNAPAYAAAKDTVEAAAATYQAALGQVGGRVASILAKDFNRIVQALIGGNSIPGITMPACHASAEITRGLLEKDRTPHAITNVPEFNSYEYTYQVEHWLNGVGDGDSSTSIDVSDGQAVNESDFGHAATDGFSYSPWISFSTAEGSSEEEVGVSYEGVDAEIGLNIQFSYDEILTVAIRAGEWNVPSPGRRYQLKTNASQESRNLAFPDYLIVVRNLGFKVGVTDSTLARRIDEKYDQAKAAGGVVRVLGIPATPDGSPDRATEGAAHFAEWDSGSGVLSVRPTADAGFASVVALVGELNIS